MSSYSLLNENNDSVQTEPVPSSAPTFKTKYYIVLIISLLFFVITGPLIGYGVLYCIEKFAPRAFINSFNHQKFDLYFNSDGTFKILQLTDMHFGDSGYGADINTTNCLRSIISKEMPNLIVLTGDIISGYVWDKDYHSTPKGCLAEPLADDPIKICVKQLLDILDSEFNIPYVFIFGNHDREAYYNTDDFLDIFSGSKNYALSSPLTKPWWKLEVKSRNNEDNIVVLYGFDTGGSLHCEEIYSPSYGCVSHEQVDWYNSQPISKYDYGISFIHIPLREYIVLYNSFTTNGSKTETSCCPMVNTGLFEALLRRKEVKLILCGHDHVNDYIGKFFTGYFTKDMFPITLGYGRKSGFGGYGDIDVGSRVIELKLNTNSSSNDRISMETYLRLCHTPGKVYQLNQHEGQHTQDPFFQDECDVQPAFTKSVHKLKLEV